MATHRLRPSAGTCAIDTADGNSPGPSAGRIVSTPVGRAGSRGCCQQSCAATGMTVALTQSAADPWPVGARVLVQGRANENEIAGATFLSQTPEATQAYVVTMQPIATSTT